MSAKGVGNQISPSWSEKPNIVSAVDGVVDLEIDHEEPVEQLDVEELCAGGRQHLSLCMKICFCLLALQKRLNERFQEFTCTQGLYQTA